MRKKVSSPTDNAAAAEPTDGVRAEETTAGADTAPTAETPVSAEAVAGKPENAPAKIRWGLIGGLCAIFVFYLTIGFIAAWLILNQIAAQTSHTASPFGTWWQVAVFVADIVFAIGVVGSYTMMILSGAKRRKDHVTQ